MASERQIAANRRNARKGTGPKSRNGKQRSATNARKHGLAQHITAQAEYARLVDALAYKIVGDTPSAIRRAYARVIAECEFELHRVRCVRVGLIERAQLSEWFRAGPEINAPAERSYRRGATAPATRKKRRPLRWTTLLKRYNPFFPNLRSFRVTSAAQLQGAIGPSVAYLSCHRHFELGDEADKQF
jgi:hypothetical protein